MIEVQNKAAKNRSPPHAIPTAADNHTEAAVVRPCTTWLVSPCSSVWSFLNINPAPRKPTPLGLAALTRDASHAMGPLRKANAELIVNRQEPSDTKDIVLIPAGRSASLRSHPIIPPSKTDAKSRLPKEHSSTVNQSRRAKRICRHGFGSYAGFSYGDLPVVVSSHGSVMQGWKRATRLVDITKAAARKYTAPFRFV